MLAGKKITAMLPRSWKKSFNNGVIIPTKMRQCNEYKDGILCVTYNNQINENKEFEANLNLLKRNLPTNLVICFLIKKYNFQLFVLNHLLYILVLFFLYYTQKLIFLISQK